MRSVVHIGPDKIGTPNLQRVFFDNREAPAAKGIAYPLTGIGTAALHNVSRALKGVSHEELGLTAAWLDELRVECVGNDTCPLLGENFHIIHEPSCLTALCSVDETQVTIYIRGHAENLVSWYQQAVQSRTTAISLDEFHEYHVLSFSRMIASWAKVYGDENVIVRLYDRRSLKGGDIFADSCDFLQPEIEMLLNARNDSSNPFAAGNLLLFMRVFNCFISRVESFSVANGVVGLSATDPKFTGRVPTHQRTMDRIKILCRDGRLKLNKSFGLQIEGKTYSVEGTAWPRKSKVRCSFSRNVGALNRKNSCPIESTLKNERHVRSSPERLL
jgi:hypothetical protein